MSAFETRTGALFGVVPLRGAQGRPVVVVGLCGPGADGAPVEAWCELSAFQAAGLAHVLGAARAAFMAGKCPAHARAVGYAPLIEQGKGYATARGGGRGLLLKADPPRLVVGDDGTGARLEVELAAVEARLVLGALATAAQVVAADGDNPGALEDWHRRAGDRYRLHNQHLGDMVREVERAARKEPAERRQALQALAAAAVLDAEAARDLAEHLATVAANLAPEDREPPTDGVQVVELGGGATLTLRVCEGAQVRRGRRRFVLGVELTTADGQLGQASIEGTEALELATRLSRARRAGRECWAGLKPSTAAGRPVLAFVMDPSTNGMLVLYPEHEGHAALGVGSISAPSWAQAAEDQAHELGLALVRAGYECWRRSSKPGAPA